VALADITMQPRVVFLTVMPSPYQQQLFKALNSDGRLKIRVLYCARDVEDRNWVVTSLAPYEEVMPGTAIRWLDRGAHVNPSITKILHKEESDLFVLSNYSAPTTQIAMRYLTWRKRNWVFWGEVPGFQERGKVGRVLRHHLQRPIGSGATAIAAIGSGAVDAYERLFPSVRVFNIPYFCDLAPFRTASIEKWTQPKPTVDILFSGQLIKRKGVDLLIRAFNEIAPQLPRMRLKLLGTGPALGMLTKLISPGLRERVQFLGFKQPADLPEVFSDADIFVLPSRHDGWGVVVNEALGAGLPIVVSDRVGARDLVESGVNGFVTAAGNIDSLATALLELGRSKALRESFGRASASLSEQWDVDEGVQRWVRLTDQVLNR
jgi:glycosyltransferase involved in cell wall biosynthesis